MVLCSCSIHAQQLRNDLGDVYYEPNFYMTKYDGPEGSPYLNETFTPAKIKGIEKTQLVRFDAVEGNVEVMISEQQVLVLNNTKKYSISLADGSDKVYETREFVNNKGDVNTSFFELLESTTNYKLYLKEEKKFFEKVQAQGYAAEKPARFEKIRDTYYVTDFKNGSEKLIPLPSKMKAFLAFFGDQGASVKKFIKDEKLKVDKTEDLVRILDYYSELGS